MLFAKKLDVWRILENDQFFWKLLILPKGLEGTFILSSTPNKFIYISLCHVDNIKSWIPLLLYPDPVPDLEPWEPRQVGLNAEPDAEKGASEILFTR